MFDVSRNAIADEIVLIAVRAIHAATGRGVTEDEIEIAFPELETMCIHAALWRGLQSGVLGIATPIAGEPLKFGKLPVPQEKEDV